MEFLDKVRGYYVRYKSSVKRIKPQLLITGKESGGLLLDTVWVKAVHRQQLFFDCQLNV